MKLAQLPLIRHFLADSKGRVDVRRRVEMAAEDECWVYPYSPRWGSKTTGGFRFKTLTRPCRQFRRPQPYPSSGCPYERGSGRSAVIGSFGSGRSVPSQLRPRQLQQMLEPGGGQSGVPRQERQRAYAKTTQ